MQSDVTSVDQVDALHTGSYVAPAVISEELISPESADSGIGQFSAAHIEAAPAITRDHKVTNDFISQEDGDDASFIKTMEVNAGSTPDIPEAPSSLTGSQAVSETGSRGVVCTPASADSPDVSEAQSSDPLVSASTPGITPPRYFSPSDVHIGNLIGYGTYGDVHEAKYTGDVGLSLPGPLAVKLLRLPTVILHSRKGGASVGGQQRVLALPESHLALLLKEAKMLLAVDSPHVVSVYGMFLETVQPDPPIQAQASDNQVPTEQVESTGLALEGVLPRGAVVTRAGIVMQRAECSLSQLVNLRSTALGSIPLGSNRPTVSSTSTSTSASYPIPRRLQMLYETALGLAHLHGHAAGCIVHGDVKAGNILVGLDGQAKICDFGFAKVRSQMSKALESATAAGATGTPLWRAPELFGRKPAPRSVATDAYAFGITMWEVLTGRAPYSDLPEEVDLLTQLGELIRDPVQPLRPDVHALPDETPLGVARLMESLWHADPVARPTMEQAARALARSSPGMVTPVTAQPEPPLPHVHVMKALQAPPPPPVPVVVGRGDGESPVTVVVPVLISAPTPVMPALATTAAAMAVAAAASPTSPGTIPAPAPFPIRQRPVLQLPDVSGGNASVKVAPQGGSVSQFAASTAAASQMLTPLEPAVSCSLIVDLASTAVSPAVSPAGASAQGGFPTKATTAPLSPNAVPTRWKAPAPESANPFGTAQVQGAQGKALRAAGRARGAAAASHNAAATSVGGVHRNRQYCDCGGSYPFVRLQPCGAGTALCQLCAVVGSVCPDCGAEILDTVGLLART